ncbi:sigma-54-dependent transcriptional regulator [Paraliomyxa miuraensis]|uniref:sigma-54-dependent transcriptional regulator n=1 Tax=Paraliomyxa miuraensis TaxID=376150 RepID=UPI0022506A1F|nr:sigma 54-interacting transcriptional regulator [Paraliomyxa miuraensis]MCX4239356.1 sigma 54-interacting transcriptional regulator [Paraliomyxa miuraensis]
MSSILIVDDEDKYLELCKRFMPEHVFLPPARNYREAARLLGRHGDGVDLVLLDVHFDIPEADLLPADKSSLMAKGDPARVLERLRRGQGLHILDHLRRDYPDLPVIVMTSRDDLPLEADAERLNAEDYTYLLDDDYLDARSLKLQIEGILARRRRAAAAANEPFYWGETSSMLAMRRRLSILARGRLPIILLGETGTGKTLLAREFIHHRSRRKGPFVAVDLSTIPRDLMAAHLFGVVKGAYTGATATRDGVLARAHEGTLFLDEIGNLNLDVQKSLLTVLQDSRYHPVGSVEERQVDVKIVVATNEDLGAMVRDGRFREDLHMRLNPATAVTLPSLRARKDDFQELMRSFFNRVASDPYIRDLLAQYAEQRGLWVPDAGQTMPIAVGRNVPTKVDPRRIHLLLQPSSFKLLREFPWPGNFRQLEMMLSNLVALTLVDLVDRAELVEPDDPSQASRPDVVPIQPRTVRELLRPMEVREVASATSHEGVVEAEDGSHHLGVKLEPGDSLNAVSCAVERQYLEALYEKYQGDLARIAKILLDDPSGGRKVQLRMNQLGIKLRKLKRRTQR